MTPGMPVTVDVTVTNGGQFDGEETAQLYIRDLVATVTQPVKELKKFQKAIFCLCEFQKLKIIFVFLSHKNFSLIIW